MHNKVKRYNLSFFLIFVGQNDGVKESAFHPQILKATLYQPMVTQCRGHSLLK
jgi:hypothetical protein